MMTYNSDPHTTHLAFALMFIAQDQANYKELVEYWVTSLHPTQETHNLPSGVESSHQFTQ